MTLMDEQEYRRVVDAALGRISRWVDGLDQDEIDFTSGDGLLTLEFADGTRYVLNRQTAARQLWFAAGARAWHYRWDGTRWVDDRDGHALDAHVADVVADKVGHRLPPLP